MALSFSLPCNECPEYLYDFCKIRDCWVTICKEKSADDGTEASKFFKRVFKRHLKEVCFVTAFDCNDRAKLFVDYLVYLKIKSKLQRVIGTKLPNIPPVRISPRNLPCRKHMFAAESDFNRCLENLKRKNEEILFQRNVRGIRLLDSIRESLNEKPCVILAMDMEVFENNPKEILEIGYAIFSMDSIETDQILACKHYIITDNKHLKNKNLMPDNRDKFRFGITEDISMAAAKKRIEEVVGRVNYIAAHAAGSLVEYLKQRGINLRPGVQVIDTKLLHTAVCPFVGEHAQRDLCKIMDDLDIPLDSSDSIDDVSQVLNNAGNDAFYTMEVFKTLVRLKPITTEYIPEHNRIFMR